MALTAVIPAEARISLAKVLDTGFRRCDGLYSAFGAGNEALRVQLPSLSARPRPSSARAA